jgi:hypothetical protein
VGALAQAVRYPVQSKPVNRMGFECSVPCVILCNKNLKNFNMDEFASWVRDTLFPLEPGQVLISTSSFE